MFRVSSRALAKMLAGMASTHSFPQRTVLVSSFLEPLHRPLAVQSPRFFANNQEKSRSFKDIGKSNAFEVGSTKFTFSIMECKSTKEIVLSISESDKETHQHRRQIWLSLTAAKTLLKRVDTNRLSTNVRSLNESCMDLTITKFEDTARQESVKLKLVRDRIGDILLRILYKRSSIFVRLDGVAFFQQKLANMIRNYEKRIDSNRPKEFEDLCMKRSFFFEPKSYFLSLFKSRVTDEILMRLSEYNKKEEKKRDMFIPIKAAQTLIDLLKEAYEIIQWHVGWLSGKQPLEVLYEKNFADQVDEYTVQAKVSEPEMRHLGDMILIIKRQRLDNEHIRCFVFIRSHGVSLLLRHYKEMLQEYDRLKPSLLEANPQKSTDLSKEHRTKLRGQEIASKSPKFNVGVTELRNIIGPEEEPLKEKIKLKEKFTKKLKEIRDKYGNLN